jgi:hypothetical protein
VGPPRPEICNYTVVPSSAGITTAVMENKSNAGVQGWCGQGSSGRAESGNGRQASGAPREGCARICLDASSTRPQHEQAGAESKASTDGCRKGGQRLGYRAGHAHGGAAAAGTVVMGVCVNVTGTGEQRFGQRREVRGACWDGMDRRCRRFHGTQRPRQEEHERGARRGRKCRMGCHYEWLRDRERATLGVADSIAHVYEIVDGMQCHATSSQERSGAAPSPQRACCCDKTRAACMAAQRQRLLVADLQRLCSWCLQ